MRIAVVARSTTPANEALVRVGCRGADWCLLTPLQALAELKAGDCAVGRLDVLPTLDGVDDGLWALGALEARGVTVLNDAPALLAAHDKLLTARLLRRAGLPHPRTRLVRDRPSSTLRPPVVVKPRFGSWGHAVERCDDEDSLAALLSRLADEPWYREHGAIVQELVPTDPGFDLRIVVAHEQVVGAVCRIAAPGEWRTNVALGATRRAVTPPPEACALALAAARATGASFVGVDLLPDELGRWVVIEINGAVEFNEQYALRDGDDPFAEATFRLGRAAICARLRGPAQAAPALRA